MAVLDSLFVELGFEIDTKELDKFKSQMEEARSSVLSFAAIAGAAAAAIGLFVFKVADGLDTLGDFAEQEQVSAEAIQELGHAAQLNGSSIDALKSSIQGLNSTAGQAITGLGRGKKAFEKFGLSAKKQDGSIKSFDELLGEIAGKMQGMDRKAAINMAQKLGLDRSLVPLLIKGKDALEAYRLEARELGITSEEDIAEAGRFADEYDRLKFTFLGAARGIAVQLMPQIREAITATRKWFVENRKVINSALGGWLKTISALLGTLWDWVSRIVGIGAQFAKWLTTSKIGVVLLAGAFGVLVKIVFYKYLMQAISLFRFLAAALTVTNVAALLTTAILGLLIAGIVLLIDDFINFREGNDSLIGDLVKDFPWLLDAISTVEQYVSAFSAFWMDIWNTLKQPLGELMGNIWSLISTISSGLWPIIKLVFQGLGIIIKAVLPLVISLFSTIVEGWVNIIGWATTAFNFIAGGWKMLFDVMGDVVGMAMEPLMKFVSMLSKGVAIAKGLFGFGGSESTLNVVRKATTDAGISPANTTKPGLTLTSPSVLNPLAQKSGVLGSTNTSTNSSQTTTTTVHAPITIKTTDPTKAGESVKKELDRMNKQATRNGQSQVTL